MTKSQVFYLLIASQPETDWRRQRNLQNS